MRLSGFLAVFLFVFPNISWAQAEYTGHSMVSCTCEHNGSPNDQVCMATASTTNTSMSVVYEYYWETSPQGYIASVSPNGAIANADCIGGGICLLKVDVVVEVYNALYTLPYPPYRELLEVTDTLCRSGTGGGGEL